MAAPRAKYRVCCLTCYTSEIGRTTSKRDADRLATSHLGAYGHDVVILPIEPTTTRTEVTR